MIDIRDIRDDRQSRDEEEPRRPQPLATERGRLDRELGWDLGLFIRVANDHAEVRKVVAHGGQQPRENEAKSVEDRSSCDSDLWVG